MTDVVEFVLGSDVRREVLARLAQAPASGRTVVCESDASESAAYDALARLANRGLAVETGAEWRLTGAGRLVADAVGRCGDVGAVVASDVDYWAAHDATGLPERFRRSIDRLAGCTVVRSPETDPYRAARRTERAIREAESVAVVAPVYSDRHAEALLETDAAEARLLVTPEMIERLLRDEPDGPDGDLGDVAVRVQPAAISMTITDRELLFSLPGADGGFDATSEVAAEAPAAIRWGRRLFEHYWAEATPVGEWIGRELPDVAAAADHLGGVEVGGESAREAPDADGPLGLLAEDASGRSTESESIGRADPVGDDSTGDAAGDNSADEADQTPTTLDGSADPATDRPHPTEDA